MRKPGTILVILLLATLTGAQFIHAQEVSKSDSEYSFRDSHLTYDIVTESVKEVRFDQDRTVPVNEFFHLFLNAFNFTDDNKALLYQTSTDKLGITHDRYCQFYKGVEVANSTYFLHSKEGNVFLANGQFIKGLHLNVIPSISEEGANESAIRKISEKSTDITVTECRLLIASTDPKALPEDYKLIYRCKVSCRSPFGLFQVDIDAASGQVLGTSPLMYEENVETTGLSPYNGMVNITVSDEDLSHWYAISNWHTDNWNAYGDTGKSWWIADTNIGNDGGYGNRWYEVLDTDPVHISGNDPVFTFMHRYRVESPSDYQLYDGWDGMNVRVSTDSGVTWQILSHPIPQYTCSSLFSFGNVHNEGTGIPGWSGTHNNWSGVSIDLTDYAGQTIMLRFAFASDNRNSTADGLLNLYGWQLDSITISSSDGILFSNTGENSGMTAHTMARDANFIEGAYRLRETRHGNGIATFNAQLSGTIEAAIDHVENDATFDEPVNITGVGLHWCLGKVYDYYKNQHGRLSYDNYNSRVIVYNNWLFDYGNGENDPNNASWGGGLMFFGNGDGINYSSFGSLDVVGHEFTHGVTEYTAGLIYQNESGALNESFSDIFGTMLEMYVEGPETGDWLMGEDPGIQPGTIIRSLENPSATNISDTYKGANWIPATNSPAWENDFGGVHANCGVQNFWYYLLAHGGSGNNDYSDSYAINGIGIADAEQIAYRNLSVYMNPTSDYFDAARYSIQSAIDIFGENSTQHLTVADAWYAVGVTLGSKIIVPRSVSLAVVYGIPENKSFYIRNLGYDTLYITEMLFAGTDYTVQNPPDYPLAILSQQSYTFNVLYNAPSAGTFHDTLTIVSNDMRYPQKKLPFTARVDPPENIVSNQDDNCFELSVRPNPFSSSVTIQFNPPRHATSSMGIYDLHGRLIRKIRLPENSAEPVSATWDGSDEQGERVAGGIYMCVLTINGHSYSRKLILE